MSPSSSRVRAPLLRQQWDRLRRLVIFVMLTLCSPLLWAKQSLHPCDGKLAAGDQCRLNINALHPSQPGIGLLQVDEEVKKLKAERNRRVEMVLEHEDLTKDSGHKIRAGDVEVTWVYSHTPAAVIEKYERKASTRMYPKFKVQEGSDA